MATFQTYQSIGNREDLTDVIYNISPTDTPFMSSVGKTKATAVYHEWQTDSLAAAAQNAVVEGADASSLTVTPTVRVGNRCQISSKTVQIAGTQESVDKAGRKSEKAYQLAKASAELKRDMEKILLDNNAAVTGDASTARELGSLQAWINTNASVGATAGAAGSLGTTARTSGDDRTFTEALLKANIKSVYEAGGNPTVLMTTPTQKQVVSTFAGIAAQRYMAPADKPSTIVGAADVYLSDFGTLSVVPNRFMTSEADGGHQAFVLDPEYAAIAYLRPFQTNELAKTGDSEKTQLLVEYTLEVKNEAAHGLIADLAE